MLYAFFTIVRGRLPDTNEWQNWWFRQELAFRYPGGHSSLFYSETGRIVSSSTAQDAWWECALNRLFFARHTFEAYKAGGSFEPYSGVL